MSVSVRTRGLCTVLMGVMGCAAAAGWSAATWAQQSPVVQSARIYIGDLHPDRVSDSAILYARIRRAAQAACGEAQSPESHFIDPDYQRCVEVAIKAAVARVDSPMLSAYYRRRASREHHG